jgi:hypothetical protein
MNPSYVRPVQTLKQSITMLGNILQVGVPDFTFESDILICLQFRLLTYSLAILGHLVRVPLPNPNVSSPSVNRLQSFFLVQHPVAGATGFAISMSKSWQSLAALSREVRSVRKASCVGLVMRSSKNVATFSKISSVESGSGIDAKVSFVACTVVACRSFTFTKTIWYKSCWYLLARRGTITRIGEEREEAPPSS